jgi:hypothetical protein
MGQLLTMLAATAVVAFSSFTILCVVVGLR